MLTGVFNDEKKMDKVEDGLERPVFLFFHYCHAKK